MARTQYTFTFTNAQPGADVGFNFPAYADSSTPDADGPSVVLDSTNSVSVWADSDYLIAHTVDGRGVQIVGVATHAYPTQTIDAGVAGTSPFGSGGSSQVLTAKTADYTAGNGDAVLVDATAAAVTITLPAPSSAGSVWVKKTDATAHTVTVATPGVETVDGADTIVLTVQNEARQINCDGTDWWVF